MMHQTPIIGAKKPRRWRRQPYDLGRRRALAWLADSRPPATKAAEAPLTLATYSKASHFPVSLGALEKCAPVWDPLLPAHSGLHHIEVPRAPPLSVTHGNWWLLREWSVVLLPQGSQSSAVTLLECHLLCDPCEDGHAKRAASGAFVLQCAGISSGAHGGL
jgi:hypothetical protein